MAIAKKPTALPKREKKIQGSGLIVMGEKSNIVDIYVKHTPKKKQTKSASAKKKSKTKKRKAKH